MSSLPMFKSKTEAPSQRRPPGALEAALVALWDDVWARRYSLRFLWARLILSPRYNLRFFKPGDFSIRTPFRVASDCEECLEVCCAGDNAIVSLRLLDIARLCDEGLSAHIAKERPDERTAVTPAKWEADNSIYHQIFPVLTRDKTGTCSLLTEDRKCGVWPNWPLSCERYPFALDVQRREIFWAAGCRSKKSIPFELAGPYQKKRIEAAVAGYNERIKDLILLQVAKKELRDLGITKHLNLPSHW